MYLNNMLPLPVNSSPGWVFPRQNFDGKVDAMNKYIARIMAGILDFKQSLERYFSIFGVWYRCLKLFKNKISLQHE